MEQVHKKTLNLMDANKSYMVKTLNIMNVYINDFTVSSIIQSVYRELNVCVKRMRMATIHQNGRRARAGKVGQLTA